MKKVSETKPKPTRYNLHISRRLFHMSTGFMIATLYYFTFSQTQVIRFLGIIACILYLLEQVRVNYPKLAKKFFVVTNYLLRAEEQLVESAAVPYTMAIFLIILSFPKTIAISSIYVLAFADPLAAIIGISLGKHSYRKNKTIEGSVTFFLVTMACLMLVFNAQGINSWQAWSASVLTSIIITAIESIPSKLDDNLIIPLSAAAIHWPVCLLFGIPFL